MFAGCKLFPTFFSMDFHIPDLNTKIHLICIISDIRLGNSLIACK